MHKSHGILAMVLWTCALAAQAQTSDEARAVARSVDRKYNNLKSLKMDFVEIYSGGGRVRKESGTLWLKQPGRMRWDYKEPTQKLFVADGKNAYFYVPGDRQARRANLKKLDDLRSPLRYLLGKAKLEQEFPNLQLADGVEPMHMGNVVVGGVPKRMTGRVQQVLFEISPQHQIERIVIEEVDGTTTEFQFLNIVEGVAVSDQSFRFERPPNVELVEATGLND